MVWCTTNYIPSKRAIIFKDESVLIELIPQSIVEMLRWPLNHNNEALNEFVSAKIFRELNPKERVTLLQSYLCRKHDVPTENDVIESILFLEIS